MINKEEEREKAMLWMMLTYILIGAGIVIPIIAFAILFFFGLDVITTIIMTIILVVTIHTTVKAIHVVPTAEEHLILVKGIYYDTWKSGGLHLLFINWPLNMRYSVANLGNIEIPFSWTEENKLQLKDVGVLANIVASVKIVDAFDSHFLTEGGFNEGVKPHVTQTLMDYIQAFFSAKTEEDSREITGKDILAQILKQESMIKDFKDRGVELVYLTFQSEATVAIQKAREERVAAEHAVEMSRSIGDAEAGRITSIIQQIAEQLMTKRDLDEEDAYELATKIWDKNVTLQTIEGASGLIITDSADMGKIGGHIIINQASERRQSDNSGKTRRRFH